MIYASTYQGALPASYTYVPNADGTPNLKPINGYIHWSSFLLLDRSPLKFVSKFPGIDPANGGPYASTQGWGMFACPSLNDGGLPPTDPARGMALPGYPQGGATLADYQAPRMAYTLNGAICPRNKFEGQVDPADGVTRYDQYVKAGSVRNSAGTILATELNPALGAVIDTDENNGNPVCKSHRPVHGFTIAGGATGSGLNLETMPAGPLFPVTASNLTSDPAKVTADQTSTRLDWVGRNHGSKRYGTVAADQKHRTDWDLRQSNFLYLDGHVESKHIVDTLAPFQWGYQAYAVTPGDVLIR